MNANGLFSHSLVVQRHERFSQSAWRSPISGEQAWASEGECFTDNAAATKARHLGRTKKHNTSFRRAVGCGRDGPSVADSSRLICQKQIKREPQGAGLCL